MISNLELNGPVLLITPPGDCFDNGNALRAIRPYCGPLFRSVHRISLSADLMSKETRLAANAVMIFLMRTQ